MKFKDYWWSINRPELLTDSITNLAGSACSGSSLKAQLGSGLIMDSFHLYLVSATCLDLLEPKELFLVQSNTQLICEAVGPWSHGAMAGGACSPVFESRYIQLAEGGRIMGLNYLESILLVID